jgi:hypothetical protein
MTEKETVCGCGCVPLKQANEKPDKDPKDAAKKSKSQ